jgi:hypothetical protein
VLLLLFVCGIGGGGKKVVWKRGGEVEVHLQAVLLIIYHAITVTVETTSMADLRQLHHLPEQFQM